MSPIRMHSLTPSDGYGVYDMIGNVWEWTTDWWTAKYAPDAAKPCCIPENPRGGPVEGSYDPCLPAAKIPRKVIKGGSHLCAPNYCRRYRPAARHAEDVEAPDQVLSVTRGSAGRHGIPGCGLREGSRGRTT